MTSSISWIDPDELKRALRGAGVGDLESSTPSGSGPADGSNALASRSAMRSSAAMQPLQFYPPDGILQDRLKSLLAWIFQATDCTGAFVMDEDGLPLLEKDVDSDLVAASASLLTLLGRLRDSLEFVFQGTLSIALSSERTLYLIQVLSPMGKYSVGFVVRGTVSSEFVSVLGRGLTLTLEMENSTLELERMRR